MSDNEILNPEVIQEGAVSKDQYGVQDNQQNLSEALSENDLTRIFHEI